jgi:hypothetical protein
VVDVDDLGARPTLGQVVDVATLTEAARVLGETAVGHRLADDAAGPPHTASA